MKDDIRIISNPESFRNVLDFSGITSVVVIADSNTMDLCYPILSCYLPADHIKIVVPAGENHKTLASCEMIWLKMLECPTIDRNSLLVNCGGGLVSDIGGFTASVFKRGIRYINFPTTLISMIDASIGGKTGINFCLYKNQIGTFYDPVKVYIYPGFLKTLGPRHILSGYGEILKYALVSDFNFWKKLKNTPPNLANPDMELLKKCIDFKFKITKQDQKESGIRKILNFGHTAGHALESLKFEKNEQLLNHGIAVAHGILIESIISNKLGLLKIEDLIEIADYIVRNFGKTDLEEPDFQMLLKFMRTDKKNLGDSVYFSLIDKPGSCLYNIKVIDEIILESLNNYVEKWHP